MRPMRIARRRMVGRAVVRTAATTAVVVGTAGAVSHAQQNKYANQQAAQQQQMQQQQMEQQQMAQPAPVAAAPAGSDMMAQLEQLSQMHNAGVLNDQEFAAAKAKLLAA
jgi:hypothetical protein